MANAQVCRNCIHGFDFRPALHYETPYEELMGTSAKNGVASEQLIFFAGSHSRRSKVYTLWSDKNRLAAIGNAKSASRLESRDVLSSFVFLEASAPEFAIRAQIAV